MFDPLLAFYNGGVVASSLFIVWLSLVVHTLDATVEAPPWVIAVYVLFTVVLWPASVLFVLWMLSNGSIRTPHGEVP
jgi:hypothetical protein